MLAFGAFAVAICCAANGRVDIMHETLRFVVARFGAKPSGSGEQGDAEQSYRPCHGSTSQMLIHSLVHSASLDQLAQLPDPHPGLSYPDALLIFLHRLGLTRTDRNGGTIALLSASLDLSTSALRAELLSALAPNANTDAKESRPGANSAQVS
jgi:hypothetical protein